MLRFKGLSEQFPLTIYLQKSPGRTKLKICGFLHFGSCFDVVSTRCYNRWVLLVNELFVLCGLHWE